MGCNFPTRKKLVLLVMIFTTKNIFEMFLKLERIYSSSIGMA